MSGSSPAIPGVHPRGGAERLGNPTPALLMNVYGHVTERMQEQATTALDRPRSLT